MAVVLLRLAVHKGESQAVWFYTLFGSFGLEFLMAERLQVVWKNLHKGGVNR